jgi:Kelch motif
MVVYFHREIFNFFWYPNSPGYDNGAVDVYDITTNSWSMSSLSEAGIQIAAAGAGNKIVFAGGYSASNGFSKTVDIYDVSTGAWTH